MKFSELKALLKEAYDHLEYCGWGDSWERECSVELKKKLDKLFEEDTIHEQEETKQD